MLLISLNGQMCEPCKLPTRISCLLIVLEALGLGEMSQALKDGSNANTFTRTHLSRSSLGRTKRPNRRSLVATRFIPDEGELKAIHQKCFQATCSVSSVTPLSNFDTNPDTWQRNKLLLTRWIKNSAVYQSLQIKFTGKLKVEFHIIEGLKGNDLDHAALEVRIKMKHEQDYVTVFVSVLCSVEREDNPEIDDTFVVLPIMLSQGNPSVKTLVEKFLMKTFDCHIKGLVFSAIELEWMLAMFSVPDAEAIKIQLTFITGQTDLKTIDYSLDINTVLKVRSEVIDEDAHELREEQVKQLVEMFGKHFRVVTGIDMSWLVLHAVDLPVLNVKDKGRVKIKSPEYMLKILRHLTAIAQGF